MAILAALIVTTFFAFKVSESRSGKKLANAQWFVYTANPNGSNFNSEKLNPANYSPSGVSDQEDRPCNSENEFCAIYAETVMVGSQQQPDLSTTQPIHSELTSYSNGDGSTTLIDEKEE